MFTLPLSEVSLNDISKVGGKNASLGEMLQLLTQKNIQVPDGFATTVEAYQRFLEHNQLLPQIQKYIAAYKAEETSLDKTGQLIRNLFFNAEFPEELKSDISKAYEKMNQQYGQVAVDVAVRSSATAEDLPDASFAGQQETFLNIRGVHDVLNAIRKCYASLFTDRAIYYREQKGFFHLDVSLSVGVQKMVRSDKSCSGVLFTLDTESGFDKVTIITGSWGLGECVVQGIVTPDEFIVYKPFLENKELVPIISKKLGNKNKKMIYASDGVGRTRIVDTDRDERYSLVLENEDILKLANWANTIETHYRKPMDIEWAKDGDSGELFIVQARPETIHSQDLSQKMKSYKIETDAHPLVEGLSIGGAIVTGQVCLIKDVEDIDQFIPGSILVTEMTDPDWVPIMNQAAGIVTNQGGRTCHAAIVSRELGVPAIVGTNFATHLLKHEQQITLSCAQGEMGFVYEGYLDFETSEVELTHIPNTQTDIMLNLANPDVAFKWWRLPSKGVGLARMEFIINNAIKIHPLALINYDNLDDEELKLTIQKMTRGYSNKGDYFVDKMASGIAKIAATQYPHPVIVRMSDFKSNEYKNLIGGPLYEPDEENPMIGYRGASRYYSEAYKNAFLLECQAITKVRNEMGFSNVKMMIPFCRTLDEADKVLSILADAGLKRGDKNLEVYVMCEVPSNVILAKEFAQKFDGFSIGSNDLTQLVLGVDRDSAQLTHLFDERNPAVKKVISQVIQVAKEEGVKVGICGQGPSDYEDFALFLVEQGIDSMSLNPDSFVSVVQKVAELENQLRKNPI